MTENTGATIGTDEAASARGCTRRWIEMLASRGAIPGARKVSGVWLLPPDFTVNVRRRGRKARK